jgi:hypothetical protein
MSAYGGINALYGDDMIYGYIPQREYNEETGISPNIQGGGFIPSGQNDPVPYGQRFGPAGAQAGRSMAVANHFNNRSRSHHTGSHQFGSYQFGRNNPNMKRNLALMELYKNNQQTAMTMPPPPPPPPPPPIIQPSELYQIQAAIQNAYANGCFGQYSQQIYNILMKITQYMPPDPISQLQSAYNNPNMSLSGIRIPPTGALWASLSSSMQNNIIAAVNNAYSVGCIPQNIYTKLQKLLYSLNTYSGPSQTTSAVITSDLTTDYNTCMANAQNPSVCMNFKAQAQSQASAFNMENGGGY